METRAKLRPDRVVHAGGDCRSRSALYCGSSRSTPPKARKARSRIIFERPGVGLLPQNGGSVNFNGIRIGEVDLRGSSTNPRRVVALRHWSETDAPNPQGHPGGARNFRG